MTEKCNSQCKYCYEKSMKEFDNKLSEKFEFDFSAPCESEVDVLKLKNFLKQDKNPVIIFYGGEPLLNIEKIKEIIDNVDAEFRMQTNGKLLDCLEIKYLKKISKILVSIDGTKERTDYNRGTGNYEKVIANIKKIREQGYGGEIVARMTIAQEFPDLFFQVMHLVELIKENLFDSIHWQIDAGFYENDFNEKEFETFVDEYNKNISKLIDWWLDEMKSGKVWKFYPFLGIFENLFYNQKAKLMCGAGHSGFAITTDSKITACPIMNNIKNFYCGNLKSKIKEIKKIRVVEPCLSCDYFENCGGRCLYSNHAKLWPETGQKLICKSVKHLVNEMKNKILEIKNLISQGVIQEKDFEFEKYFGPEIIP